MIGECAQFVLRIEVAIVAKSKAIGGGIRIGRPEIPHLVACQDRSCDFGHNLAGDEGFERDDATTIANNLNVEESTVEHGIKKNDISRVGSDDEVSASGTEA